MGGLLENQRSPVVGRRRVVPVITGTGGWLFFFKKKKKIVKTDLINRTELTDFVIYICVIWLKPIKTIESQ